MKKTIPLYGVFIVCCVSILALMQLWGKKEKQTTPIIEQRDTSRIDPFAVAARVELVTYKNNRMDWWIDEDGTDRPHLKNGTLNMPVDSIHSRVYLDSAQVAKWQSALYIQHFCQENIIALCYEPRHLLLFYTPDRRIFGYIEICLSCAGGRISEGLREVVFCPERIGYLVTLMREVQR